jgi:hypothetical protein
LGDESGRRGGGQDQGTGPLAERYIGPNTNFSGNATNLQLEKLVP